MQAVERKLKRLDPLGARVLVRPLDEDELSPGGIVLPDNVKEKPQKGVVVAVGPGDWIHGMFTRYPISVHDGDVVLFAKYAGSEVRLNGIEYLILREDDILAVERDP